MPVHPENPSFLKCVTNDVQHWWEDLCPQTPDYCSELQLLLKTQMKITFPTQPEPGAS